MTRAIVILLALGASAPALAIATAPGPKPIVAPAPTRAERPLVAPAPAWVLPAPIPPAPPEGEGGSIVILLSDQQAHLTREGNANYFASAYRIGTPQGLDDAALNIVWDPDLESLTIHRFRIWRDGKPTDLLGDGSKITVVRRETNLERATLDGRLTATLQPEDVRVGDTIDLAFTRVRRDPALGGHSEDILGTPDGVPIGRARVRALWSAEKPLRWQAVPGVVQPKLLASGNQRDLVADLTNVTTLRGPKGAPPRFLAVNAMEVSDFASWGEVSRLAHPLYASAAAIKPGGPLAAEIARIAAANPTPKARTLAALRLVEDQVRYLFLGMADGGYVPAPAELTWSRRFGDCKGKTVLLVSLLKGLGIEARPVLVNTQSGDWLPTRLPAMGAFDHVMVQAKVAGRTYWLDGTRLGDRDLDRLRAPFYVHALPVTADGSGLVDLAPPPLEKPEDTIALDLDATGGVDVPAAAKAEMRFEGEAATEMRLKLTELTPGDRDRELRKLWRGTFDFIAPATVGIGDGPDGAFVLKLTGTAKMNWTKESGTRWYELDGARVGFKIDITRDDMLNKTAPYSVGFPDWKERRETILLPGGGRGFALQGGNVDQTVGGAYRFHRDVKLDGNKLTMVASTRALAPEFPGETAETVKTQLSELAEVGVFLRLPTDYQRTEAEMAVLQKAKPTDAEGYLTRAATLFDHGKVDAALVDLEAALKLNPDSAGAHAIRAMAWSHKDDPRADAEAQRAIALDPKRAYAWKARANVAMRQHRLSDANDHLSIALQLAPRDAPALLWRGGIRADMGRYADAIADLDAALAIDSGLARARELKPRVLAMAGRRADALADADRILATNPQSLETRMLRAELRMVDKRPDDARADYDAILAAKPDAAIALVGRAYTWGPDKAKRAADVAAALKLNPAFVPALKLAAADAATAHDYAVADAALVRAEAAAPTDMQVASMRAEVLGLAGKRPEAMRVLDAAVARAPRDPGVLNSRCWLKATWNIHAESAVADCDAALAVRPANPAVLDSRGFAHLRAGHWDAAIADYDAALKLAPTLAPSLYGRGLAKLRKSQAQSAGLDFRAARAVAPQIDQQFIGYGIAAPDASAHIALAPPHGTLRPVQVAAPLAAIGPRSPVPATVPSPATAPREARYPASPGAIHNP